MNGLSHCRCEAHAQHFWNASWTTIPPSSGKAGDSGSADVAIADAAAAGAAVAAAAAAAAEVLLLHAWFSLLVESRGRPGRAAVPHA